MAALLRAGGRLARYRAKRDFSMTAEPSGRIGRQTPATARFVIHKHAARSLHYDLRLGVEGVLKSWAVTKQPSLDPAIKRLAVEVEDHPLEYGDFEGTIPAGQYGGGTVMIWDRGLWTSQSPERPASALAKGELKFTLQGNKLRGSFVLVRIRHDRLRTKQTPWLLIKHRDRAGQHAREVSTRRDDTSVSSGRSMTQIARGKGKGPTPFVTGAGAGGREKSGDPAAVWNSGQPDEEDPSARRRAPPVLAALGRAASQPDFVSPQLCITHSAPPEGSNWVHEVKLDGYRIQLRVKDGKVRLGTRNGLDWTERFAQVAIAAAAAKLPDVIIDGEIVALDARGIPDFTALQVAVDEHAKARPLVYYAFDLLYAAGRDLRDCPLTERKAALASLLGRGRSRNPATLRFVAHLPGPGASVLRSACAMGLEGIVSKRLDAAYRSGRTRDWAKVKCRPGQEVVIAGWSGSRNELRSLLVGVHRNAKLVDAGRVGTGFNAEIEADLLTKLRPLATKACPFASGEPARTPSDVTWVRPELVAEIAFAGWTGDGRVRQGSFKGIRSDKPASEITAEPAKTMNMDQLRANSSSGVGVMGVAISNPGKPLWPAGGATPQITKADLARYLEAVAPRMMPYLAGRPCSLVRAPDGINGQQFFQRHASRGMSELFTAIKVSGDRQAYVQIDRPEALIAAAQMGAVEFHPWNCVPGRVDEPGRLVFDLDPAPDVPFADVVAAAKELRERLGALGLESFCKTTGGKGLHVVTPLDAVRTKVGWPAAKAFAREVCVRMAADSPSRFLVKMTKALRGGRIFLDYLRNDTKSTAVALLSPRARPGATVSMPLSWAQVRSGLDPKRFTISTAPALLSSTRAWADYERAATPLAPAIKRLGKARS